MDLFRNARRSTIGGYLIRPRLRRMIPTTRGRMLTTSHGYVLVRSHDILWADVVDLNGDLFPLEEFEAPGVVQSLVGVPVYTDRDEGRIEFAKGTVIYAELDPETGGIDCTFLVDGEAWPQLAMGIRRGYITNVAARVAVEWSRCSVCGNRATSERLWCEHLRTAKGPGMAHEINHGLRFVGLHIVSDGAFSRIDEVFPFDSITNGG